MAETRPFLLLFGSRNEAIGKNSGSFPPHYNIMFSEGSNSVHIHLGNDDLWHSILQDGEAEPLFPKSWL